MEDEAVRIAGQVGARPRDHVPDPGELDPAEMHERLRRGTLAVVEVPATLGRRHGGEEWSGIALGKPVRDGTVVEKGPSEREGLSDLLDRTGGDSEEGVAEETDQPAA